MSADDLTDTRPLLVAVITTRDVCATVVQWKSSTMPRQRTWSFTCTVVGLQFRWKMTGREMLARAAPFPVELEREPDNPADENAIKVNIAATKKLTKLKGAHLGYLRKEVAAMLAPRLDAGQVAPVKLWVTEVEPRNGEATLSCRFKDAVVKPKVGS
jgi:hypothetical protein